MFEITYDKYDGFFLLNGERFNSRDEAEYHYVTRYVDNRVTDFKHYTVHYTNDYKTIERVEVHI